MSEEVEKAPAPVNGKGQKNGTRKKIIIVVVAVLAILALIKGIQIVQFGQTHAETDNAYITGDLVSISPTVSGTLATLTVKEGDFVKKGAVIATLDDSGSQARLAQARANLEAAQAAVAQAKSALTYQAQSTSAAVQKTRAALAAQQSRTKAARLQRDLSQETVKTQIVQAKQMLDETKAEANQQNSAIGVARANLANATQAVETARNNAAAMVSTANAAKANADKTRKDLARYESLLKQDAITKQQYDQVEAAAIAADADLTAAQERADAADSQVGQAQSAVAQAASSLAVARNQADAAQKRVASAQSGVDLAKINQSQVPIRTADIATSEGVGGQAAADLTAAQAGQTQVVGSEDAYKTAVAHVAQAAAELASAQIEEGDRTLTAPYDGYVVKQAVNVGAAISAGQMVISMTKGSGVWVVANYKETQLSNMKVGMPAEIAVDAFPGVTFEGKVTSLYHATGSATTLLPPDNATGNFTKVVQRIPVRIDITGVKGQGHEDDLKQLAQGMSVTATVDTAVGK